MERAKEKYLVTFDDGSLRGFAIMTNEEKDEYLKALKQIEDDEPYSLGIFFEEFNDVIVFDNKNFPKNFKCVWLDELEELHLRQLLCGKMSVYGVFPKL